MKRPLLNWKKPRITACLFAAAGALNAVANPTGLTVSSGTASAEQMGSQLNITVSQLAVLNWSSFNIADGETTSFLQPSSSSVVLNLIGGANPSQIFGNLNANGTVILENANGFYFGPNSMIKVGGSFLATTAPLTPDFGAGSTWQFTGMPPLASIVNYGQIQVGQGRSLFLIAENIANYGSLNAPGGNMELAAGQNVLVSESPDGRSLSAQVQLPQGSVDNFGNVIADAGMIALQAKVVNEDGVIQADSVQSQNGTIVLAASDQLNLGANSQISADGDASSGGSAGGTITLQSGNDFSGSVGSQISAKGGSQGGNGGSVEISAPNVLSLNSAMDASAQSGGSAGTFLLDPTSIILGTSTANGAINVNTAFAGFSTILLQASGTITLNSGTSWNLSSSTGNGAGQLTLEAGTDIIFGNNSKIVDANNWSVTLDAGYNSANGTIQSGVGNIYLNGGSGLSQNGTIQLAGGSINLWAGQNILVGSGSIFTTSGGSIFADALAGNINAGTDNGSSSIGSTQTSDYLFRNSGSMPNGALGGISTAAGGNVTLLAGANIISVPLVPANQWPGASGAYGAGNVTLVAGNQITGNYNLANGVGTILAGVQASSAQATALVNANTSPSGVLSVLETTVENANSQGNGNIGSAAANGGVALSLIQGSWNAWAANSIYLNEVNNPNGSFNTIENFSFTYAPDAAANFWAGNAITLGGGNLARVSRQNQSMLPIYAPILALNAGAGGITVDNSIIVFPSSEGDLQITTRDGGNLSGALASSSSTLTGITMSDSTPAAGWATFAQGHADPSLYLNDPNEVLVNISGSIESFSLTVPTFAEINVVGNTYNFGFLGQNLSPAQMTSINVGKTAKINMEDAGLLNSATDGGLLVGGSISYRGDLTTIDLTSAELADLLPVTLFHDSTDTGVTSKLSYNPATGQLSYVGVMSAADLAFLLNPSIVVLDSNGNPETVPVPDGDGNPVLDPDGNPETVTVTAPLALNATQQAMLQQLYTASQTASLGDNGLALSGPGEFNINAGTIDLGISGGISVLAPDAALAAISPYGANINIQTAGDLQMTTTAIANESYLGGINLMVKGELDAGGELTVFGDPSSPKGIFTTSGGDVSVTAAGNINLEGSRIAAYDGGNVTIQSLTGDIDAGIGGSGYVTLDALQYDPITQQLTSIPATIPGSGILATTVAGSDALLGNILVETPHGNFSASQGGVIQLSFNNTDSSAAIAYILAGYELVDPSGQNPLTADDISAADHLQNNPAGSQYAATLFDGAGNIIGQLVSAPTEENIDASGSGVIGQNIIARATGQVQGLFIGLNNVDLDANHLNNVFVVGRTVDLTSTEPTGPGIEVISDNPVSVNGQLEVSAPPETVAPTAEVAPQAASATTATSKTADASDDDKKKKNGQHAGLAQKTSRVTVTLPPKNNSHTENKTSTPSS